MHKYCTPMGALCQSKKFIFDLCFFMLLIFMVIIFVGFLFFAI
ncbi:hypothetical protein HMPREF1570_3103 [Klebsiella oxytoca KA-2]|nr:hypothetical protein HMPREF1570_3103 [Klebsiella oxytoca KA-2]